MAANPTANPLTGPAPRELGPVGGGPMNAEMESGANLGDAVRVIKQRLLTIIITFVLLFILVIAGTVAVWKFAPLYTSEAILEVQPPRKDALSATDELVDPDRMRRELETAAAKIRNLSLLQDVLALPEIKATSFYKHYEKQANGFQKCLFDFEEMVRAAPIPDTNLIQISFATGNKEEARLIVQKVIDKFLDRFRDTESSGLLERAESIRKTMADSQNQLAQKRAELSRFRAQTNVGNLDVRAGELMQKMAMLNSQMTAYQSQLAAYQAQLARLQNVPIGELPVTPEMELIIESDPMVRFYRSNVESLEVERNVMQRSGIGPNHRSMQAVDSRRQGYLEKEMARREEMMDKLRRRQVDEIEQNAQQIQGMINVFQDELEQAQAEQRDMDANLQKVEAMMADIDLLTTSLTQLEEAKVQAEHVSRDRGQLNRVAMVQAPQLAVKPTRPDFIFYLGGGFILALLGGVGMAFLREFTDQAVRTPLDVVRVGQLPVLGVIPDLDDEEADVDDIEFATLRAPHSLVAEGFRQVRTNLSFSGPPESQRTILVTSPSGEDGKTAVAINLAVTLAQGGLRVLLIDCNLRRPRLRELFRESRPEGLSNVLIGQGELSEYATPTELPNLELLSSGPVPPTPAELLGSPRMQQILAQALERYDRVVLDGPPVLLVSDALVVGSFVSGVILVARAVQNRKGALKRAKEQLERCGIRLIGAVLNGAEARPGGYFRQQYREFYDYVGDEGQPRDLLGPPPDDDSGLTDAEPPAR